MNPPASSPGAATAPGAVMNASARMDKELGRDTRPDPSSFLLPPLKQINVDVGRLAKQPDERLTRSGAPLN